MGTISFYGRFKEAEANPDDILAKCQGEGFLFLLFDTGSRISGCP